MAICACVFTAFTVLAALAYSGQFRAPEMWVLSLYNTAEKWEGGMSELLWFTAVKCVVIIIGNI